MDKNKNSMDLDELKNQPISLLIDGEVKNITAAGSITMCVGRRVFQIDCHSLARLFCASIPPSCGNMTTPPHNTGCY